MVQILKNSKLIAFEIVTNNMVPMDAEIVGISFSIEKSKAYYVPLKYYGKEKNDFGENDEKTVLKALSKIFEDSSNLKTSHNIKFFVH